MKSNRLLPVLLLCGSLITPALAKERDKKHGSEAELKAQATVTEDQAKQTALTKAPGGKIASAELENEKGQLVWSVTIAAGDAKNLTEVAVDAKTGAIVSVTQEAKHEEKEGHKEKHKDKKEKSKKDRDEDDDEGKDAK